MRFESSFVVVGGSQSDPGVIFDAVVKLFGEDVGAEYEQSDPFGQ